MAGSQNFHNLILIYLSQNKKSLLDFFFSLKVSFPVLLVFILTTFEKKYFGKLGSMFVSSPSFHFKRYEKPLEYIAF
jgi:hypothetical protein